MKKRAIGRMLAVFSIIMPALPASAQSRNPAPAALAIATSSPLPAGTMGVAYSQTLAATGGTTPYTWSLASGSLPPGLGLQQQFVILPVPGPAPGWAIGGTPTAAGTYTFTVRVRDGAGRTAQRSFSITIQRKATPAISPANSGWRT